MASLGAPPATAHRLAAPLPPLEGVTHSFLDLPGLRMHVAQAGSGDPVLLLHGFPQHWWVWRGVIPGLSQDHRVVCPDLRGAGWTDAPAHGYTRAQLLADVVALLDALELERVDVVAHDWGALLGFQLCLERPHRVRRFVSLSVPHPYARWDLRLLRAVPHAWYQLAVAAPVLGPRALGQGRQRLPRWLFRHFAADPAQWSAEDVEAFLAPLRDPAVARAGAALYRGFISPEAVRIFGGSYRDRRLTTPTLVLVGAADPVVRAELLGGHEQHADDLRVEAVEGASHWLADERPDVVVARSLELFVGT